MVDTVTKKLLKNANKKSVKAFERPRIMRYKHKNGKFVKIYKCQTCSRFVAKNKRRCIGCLGSAQDGKILQMNEDISVNIGQHKLISKSVKPFSNKASRNSRKRPRKQPLEKLLKTKNFQQSCDMAGKPLPSSVSSNEMDENNVGNAKKIKKASAQTKTKAKPKAKPKSSKIIKNFIPKKKDIRYNCKCCFKKTRFTDEICLACKKSSNASKELRQSNSQSVVAKPPTRQKKSTSLNQLPSCSQTKKKVFPEYSDKGPMKKHSESSSIEYSNTINDDAVQDPEGSSDRQLSSIVTDLESLLSDLGPNKDQEDVDNFYVSVNDINDIMNVYNV